MSSPPPYLRIPYLWRRDPGPDDQVVKLAERSQWFTQSVLVEEKLDGANVALWLEGGHVSVATRGGPGAMDRAGQLGRLRAWVAERAEQLTPVLTSGAVVYGEWLWLTHGVQYDALQDFLVVLDLWTPESGFAPVSDRDAVAEMAELPVPPPLFEGTLGERDRLDALLGRSGWSSQPMEGAVLRLASGARAKVLRPGYSRRTDAQWRHDRQLNGLAPAEVPHREVHT